MSKPQDVRLTDLAAAVVLAGLPGVHGLCAAAAARHGDERTRSRPKGAPQRRGQRKYAEEAQIKSSGFFRVFFLGCFCCFRSWWVDQRLRAKLMLQRRASKGRKADDFAGDGKGKSQSHELTHKVFFGEKNIFFKTKSRFKCLYKE